MLHVEVCEENKPFWHLTEKLRDERYDANHFRTEYLDAAPRRPTRGGSVSADGGQPGGVRRRVAFDKRSKFVEF